MTSDVLLPLDKKINWEKWHFKVGAIVLPAAATLLAISYDVGYFIGIDLRFFTFFSLSEHIVFALVALPLIILLLFSALLGLAVVTGLVNLLNKVFPTKPKPKPEAVNWRRPSMWVALFAIVAIFVSLTAFVVYLAVQSDFFAPIAGGL